jgi:hypothetical protein
MKRNKPGKPRIYETDVKQVTRSVPIDLVPKLDEWLKSEKAKYLKTGKK